MKGGKAIELVMRDTENYKIEIEQLDKSDRTPTAEKMLSQASQNALMLDESVREEQLLVESSVCSEDIVSSQDDNLGESDKFICPNGHFLMIIDGAISPLASQECSAFCGMANTEDNRNWLHCEECNYNVCHDCFHCTEGHELQPIAVADLPQEFNELICQSCENEITDYASVCVKVA